MDNIDYRVYFLDASKTNCSNLRLSVFLHELEKKGAQTNITTLRFEKERFNSLRCKISMSDFKNSSGMKLIKESEFAFMKYKGFDYLNLRIYFVIEGL